MGFWSSVGSFVCSAISSAVSAIGRGLSSFASTISAGLGAIFESGLNVVERIVEIAGKIFQAFKILKEDEPIEEVGERALQAAEQGITIDRFPDFESYMAALRNFEIDPEKAAKRSLAEKQLAGIGVGTAGLEKQLNYSEGALANLWLLTAANPDFFNAERLQSLVTTGRFTADIALYLEKRLSGAAAERLEAGFVKTFGEREGLAPETVYRALDSAVSQWHTLKLEAEKRATGQ